MKPARLIAFSVSWLLAVCLWNNTSLWRARTVRPRVVQDYRPPSVADYRPPVAKAVPTSGVRYVLIVHSTGDGERMKAVGDTWFREAADVGLVIMLRGFSTTAFEATRATVARALRSFPDAAYFGKFDDDAYVYTRELWRQVEAGRFNYSGYPIRLGDDLVFASGGAGYVLSRSAAEVVAACAPPDGQYEDAAVGRCLQKVTPLHDLIGLHPHHPYQMLRWDKHGHPSDRVHRREPLEGYLNPLSYHYMPPEDIVRMHDDAHNHGAPLRRRAVPKIIHQFWEGEHGRPEVLLQKCKDMHPDWEHRVWNNAEIRKHFPSAESTVGFLPRDGAHGELVNQDLYGGVLNLLSDIMRYEVLMLYGGVYVDADTECFRPMDHLLKHDVVGDAQGFGFLEKDKEYHNGLVASGVIGTRAYSPLSVALVSELQRTDWNLPPWQSAGPLFFTKTLHLFDSDPTGYLGVKVLDSFHVYPFHYSDKKPESHELPSALIQKGAVMDQKWGTTHGSYGNSKWAKLAAVETSVDLDDERWERALRDYSSNVHAVGLSTLAKSRPRWVVAAVHPLAGMCNRITHILSTLAFAMATGRVLLFDWERIPSRKHENGIEDMGHSDYYELFRRTAIHHSYADALRLFSWTDAKARDGSVTIVHDNVDFLRSLRFSDLDSKYPQSVIFLERFDYWAPPLMLNPLYSETVFMGDTSERVFAVLFKFLFSPKSPVVGPVTCDWLIQRRAIWERKTAPLESFVACGKQHGLAAGEHGVVLVSDSTAPSNTAITLVESTGCRTGLECDLQAVRQMHAYSACKHAVLTATSTFGTCIAGLGEIKDTYIVKEDGSCHARVNPVMEAGVLDHQPHQISNVINAPSTPDPRLAFVMMMISPSDKAVRDFQVALQALHEHFNRHHHYPLVLFVDDPLKWQYLQFVVSIRVHVVAVNASDWAIPAGAEPYPEVFRLKSVPEHKGFNLDYRRMSRYASGFLFSHPALERFEYVLKLDSDTFAYAPWQKDPLFEMHAKKAKMGFWISYEDMGDVTEGLWEAFVDYVRKHKLTLKQPGLVMDAAGRFRRTNLYGCFLGARTEWFRSREYQTLFEHFDQTGGFFRYRWDEQKLFAFYVALYAEPQEVEYFSYVQVEHQQWARTASRLEIANVPESVLRTVFY